MPTAKKKKTTRKKKDPIEDLIDEQEMRKEVMRVSAEYIGSIERRVTGMLNKSVGALIGIDTSWGRTEVDHCNGRMSSIKERCEKAASDHLDKVFKEVLSEEAIRKEINKAAKECLKYVAEHAEREIRTKVREEVEALTQEIARTRVREEFEKLGYTIPRGYDNR